MIVLGEAYAFGVVWSFVFKALAMVVLRFRDRRPREFMVPLNIKIGNVEIPIGLSLIFLVLLAAGDRRTFDQRRGHEMGPRLHGRVHDRVRRHGAAITNAPPRRRSTNTASNSIARQPTKSRSTGLGLDKKPYRKLVAIRSPNNLFMLEKALAESDPATTFVDRHDGQARSDRDARAARSRPRHLRSAADDGGGRAGRKSGKEVMPLIVPTNNPLFAVVRTANDLEVQEMIVGVSNKNTADEQLDQSALYWFNLCDGNPRPMTVRIVSRDREVHLDLAGGNRVPKISERQARSVAELRAAGIGVNRVLLAHDGTSASHDLFQDVLTMLDPWSMLQVGRARGNKLAAVEAQKQHRSGSAMGETAGGRDIDSPNSPANLVPNWSAWGARSITNSSPWRFRSPGRKRPAINGQIPWLGHVLEHAACPVIRRRPARNSDRGRCVKVGGPHQSCESMAARRTPTNSPWAVRYVNA